MTKRITNHPVLKNKAQKKEITFTFNNQELIGHLGESLAAALLANDIRTLRVHEETGEPRGIYCNIGYCYECRLTINSVQGVRACLTPLTENMIVESGEKQPTTVKDWRHSDEQ